MITIYFDDELRQYTSLYSDEYGGGELPERYQPTEEELRRRRRIRNAAIGAGAAALLAGGGLMYLNHKGGGSISKGWRNVKTGWADKLSGGRISKLESANRDAQKALKSQHSKMQNLESALQGSLSANARSKADISKYQGIISEKNQDIANLSGSNGMKNLAKGLTKSGKEKVKSFLGRLVGRKR